VELFFSTLESLEKTNKFNAKTQILILDGIPRTISQADMLKDKVEVLKIIYLLSSDDNILAERIENRAKIEGRGDDNIDVLKKRLEIYRKETFAVLKKYPSDILIEVDGFGKIETIYEEIIEKLDQDKFFNI
jgi:adenylate kinase